MKTGSVLNSFSCIYLCCWVCLKWRVYIYTPLEGLFVLCVSWLGLALLGWQTEGSRFNSTFALLSLKVVVCGHCLMTLSPHNQWNVNMALITAHLNVGVMLVVTVWHYMYSLPHPPPPGNLVSTSTSLEPTMCQTSLTKAFLRMYLWWVDA